MNHKKAFHIVLTGRVQGVGFRHFVQKTALTLHLEGWVRNKADGSVELEVEGREETIQIFLDLVKRGNSFSRVDRMFKTELPETSGYQSFFIKY
ncbi:MAG: acylphosphatase [Mangrovibacterium sp.]